VLSLYSGSNLSQTEVLVIEKATFNQAMCPSQHTKPGNSTPPFMFRYWPRLAKA